MVAPRPDRTSELHSLLIKRAELFSQIRSFFSSRHVLEVEAPLVVPATVTDLHIESVPVSIQERGKWHEHYLITSPEFFMKRLLCRESPDIFYLGKVFRQEEHGKKHHHEFTMLEWYRRDWDEHRLMEEVCDLLRVFAPGQPVQKISYRKIFLEVLAINPHVATEDQLRTHLQNRIDVNAAETLTRNDCLELLFTHCIEPVMTGITLVYDYPESQAALAQISGNVENERVARRFEVFWDGLELGNGYFELRDASEQKSRFQSDLEKRVEAGKKIYPHDEDFLRFLRQGLPPCAGVALGVDRLLMKLLGAESLRQVIPALLIR